MTPEPVDETSCSGGSSVDVKVGDLDVGSDGTVGIRAPAKGRAKFFRVVVPKQ